MSAWTGRDRRDDRPPHPGGDPAGLADPAAGPVLFTSNGWVLSALLVVPFLLAAWLARPPQVRFPVDPRTPRDR